MFNINLNIKLEYLIKVNLVYIVNKDQNQHLNIFIKNYLQVVNNKHIKVIL